MMRYLWIPLAACALGGWHWWTSERPVARPPGILAAAEPLQRALDAPGSFEARGVTMIARARYTITARVLRRENYRLDGGADIAPVDLAVGWGPMSDSRVIDALEFSQMGRFFYWKPKRPDTLPIPVAMLVTNAAQMHLIPATPSLEKQMKKLRPGQLVTIDGYLVDVRGPGGFAWNTSRTRSDTGNGACEIVWVDALAVE
jgi:hypothetical protein